jgi:hypothetical protein
LQKCENFTFARFFTDDRTALFNDAAPFSLLVSAIRGRQALFFWPRREFFWKIFGRVGVFFVVIPIFSASAASGKEKIIALNLELNVERKGARGVRRRNGR